MVKYNRTYKGYELYIHSNYEGLKNPIYWYSIIKYDNEKLLFELIQNDSFTNKTHCLKVGKKIINAIVKNPELLKSSTMVYDILNNN